jgi:hypothetical protein
MVGEVYEFKFFGECGEYRAVTDEFLQPLNHDNPL